MIVPVTERQGIEGVDEAPGKDSRSILMNVDNYYIMLLELRVFIANRNNFQIWAICMNGIKITTNIWCPKGLSVDRVTFCKVGFLGSPHSDYIRFGRCCEDAITLIRWPLPGIHPLVRTRSERFPTKVKSAFSTSTETEMKLLAAWFLDYFRIKFESNSIP